jgi:hypothetical protein
VSALEIVRQAGAYARARVEIVLHPQHFEVWRNVGLAQAVRAIPADLAKGSDPPKGRAYLRKELERMTPMAPVVQVDASARWTLAALSAGYAQKPGRTEPEPGIHRSLMEGLEAGLGLMAMGLATDNSASLSYTADGRPYRRYQSAFAQRGGLERRHGGRHGEAARSHARSIWGLAWRPRTFFLLGKTLSFAFHAASLLKIKRSNRAYGPRGAALVR